MPAVTRKPIRQPQTTTAPPVARVSPNALDAEGQALGQLGRAVGGLAQPLANLFDLRAQDAVTKGSQFLHELYRELEIEFDADPDLEDQGKRFQTRWDEQVSTYTSGIKNSRGRKSVEDRARQLRVTNERKISGNANRRFLREYDESFDGKIDSWASRFVNGSEAEKTTVKSEMEAEFTLAREAKHKSSDEIHAFRKDFDELVEVKEKAVDEANFELMMESIAEIDGREAAIEWAQTAGRAEQWGLKNADTQPMINIQKSRLTVEEGQVKKLQADLIRTTTNKYFQDALEGNPVDINQMYADNAAKLITDGHRGAVEKMLAKPDRESTGAAQRAMNQVLIDIGNRRITKAMAEERLNTLLPSLSADDGAEAGISLDKEFDASQDRAMAEQSELAKQQIIGPRESLIDQFIKSLSEASDLDKGAIELELKSNREKLQEETARYALYERAMRQWRRTKKVPPEPDEIRTEGSRKLFQEFSEPIEDVREQLQKPVGADTILMVAPDGRVFKVKRGKDEQEALSQGLVRQ